MNHQPKHPIYQQPIIWLLLIILSAHTSWSQVEQTKSSYSKHKIVLGSGFVGLLQVDEISDGYRFPRKALPPFFVNYQYQIMKRLSIGVYYGIEHEMQSGSLIGFEGPNTSQVYGLFTDFHFIGAHRNSWFDPYIGLSMFNYSGSILGSNFSPALRLGSNFRVYQKLGISFNTGLGAALFELGISYSLWGS